MKNYRKISPRRLKKLIKNYQVTLNFYHESCKFWEKSSNHYFNLWINLLRKKTKDDKKALIWIMSLIVVIIIQSILYFLK